MSLRVQLDLELERKFRQKAMKRFGYGKGALRKAAQEAIVNWMSNVEKEEISFEEDPVKAIECLLKEMNIDSVKLQHETQKLWAKKVVDHVPC